MVSFQRHGHLVVVLEAVYALVGVRAEVVGEGASLWVVVLSALMLKVGWMKSMR